MNRHSLAAVAAALCILLASCSSSKSDNGTPATGAGAPAASGVVVKNFAYSGTLTVKVGAKVSVTNQDSTPHSVTDKGGKFDSGVIGGDGTGSFTAPSAPGSYQLICTLHPEMAGTLVVQ
jgi:plastocyanin